MRGFYGRRQELARLDADLEAIRSDGRGRLITVRGRRRVGKSWLIEEFIERSKAPHVFFAASRQTPERELARFGERFLQIRAGPIELCTLEDRCRIVPGR